MSWSAAGLLDALPEDDRRTRARVLGRLGVELYYADGAGRARGEVCSAEAVALARATGDAEALGAALHAQRISLWRADRLDERLATSRELIALGERERLLELEVQGRHWYFVDLLESGDAEAADDALERYAEVTERLGSRRWSWYVPLWRGCRAAMAGRYAEAMALGEEAARIGTLAGDPNAARDAWIQATAGLFLSRSASTSWRRARRSAASGVLGGSPARGTRASRGCSPRGARRSARATTSMRSRATTGRSSPVTRTTSPACTSAPRRPRTWGTPRAAASS